MHYSIYTLTCKNMDITDSYVGRTSLNPILRFRHHKTLSTKKSCNLYDTINKHGGIDNWEMTIVEEGDTYDLDLAKQREQFYLKLFKANLNYNMPNRTYKEWRSDNKQHYNDYMRNYMRKYNNRNNK
jgi:hypothetical protein